MKKATGELWVEGEKALVAHKKDSQEDLDGDGIPDVEQISPREKVSCFKFEGAGLVRP